MTCCSSLLRGSVLATRAAFCKVYVMNLYQEASMSSMSRRHQKIGLITVCLCISSSTNCDLESDRGKVDWRTFFQTGWRFKPRTCSHLVLSPLLLLYCLSESSESLLNWRLPVYAPAGQWRLIPERKQSIAFRLCRHRRRGEKSRIYNSAGSHSSCSLRHIPRKHTDGSPVHPGDRRWSLFCIPNRCTFTRHGVYLSWSWF